MSKAHIIKDACDELSQQACELGAAAFGERRLDAATDYLEVVDACNRIRAEVQRIEALLQSPATIVASSGIVSRDVVSIPAYPRPSTLPVIDHETPSQLDTNVADELLVSPAPATTSTNEVLFSRKRTYHADRQPRHGRTPEEAFVGPVVQALHELGGAAHIKQVRELVEKKMIKVFIAADRQVLPADNTIRWHTTMSWAASAMRSNGLLEPSTKQGYWQLTQHGKDLATTIAATAKGYA